MASTQNLPSTGDWLLFRSSCSVDVRNSGQLMVWCFKRFVLCLKTLSPQIVALRYHFICCFVALSDSCLSIVLHSAPFTRKGPAVKLFLSDCYISHQKLHVMA